jgi:predicted nucleic acid-binding protein
LRFIDSNIFLHAFLKPRRGLNQQESLIKEQSKTILGRVEQGEAVALSVVHLSEVINILESGRGLQAAQGFLAWVISSENIVVYPISIEDYEVALPLSEEFGISPNDALAVNKMRSNNLEEIYSHDKHFDKVEYIKKLSS